MYTGKHVHLRPLQPAFIMANSGEALTYRELEARENRLAHLFRKHGLKRLVYYERHDTIRAAIQREKNIKHWPRAWKVRLIHSMNPEWNDLFDMLI